jgi:plastocyanin
MPKSLSYTFALIVLLSGCSTATKTSEANTPKAVPVTDVSPAMKAMPSTATQAIPVTLVSTKGQLQFLPAKISAKAGDTIVWKMDLIGPHQISFISSKVPDLKAAKAMSILKPAQKPGLSFVTVIPTDAKPGVYPFFSPTHKLPAHPNESMVGELTIVAG